MHAVFHRELFGRQPKSIETHGMQNIMPRHALMTRHDIGRDIAQRMANMQAHTRGIGEHIEHVILGLGSVEAFIARPETAESLLGLPMRLPFRFDCLWFVLAHDRVPFELD